MLPSQKYGLWQLALFAAIAGLRFVCPQLLLRLWGFGHFLPGWQIGSHQASSLNVFDHKEGWL